MPHSIHTRFAFIGILAASAALLPAQASACAIAAGQPARSIDHSERGRGHLLQPGDQPDSHQTTAPRLDSAVSKLFTVPAAH